MAGHTSRVVNVFAREPGADVSLAAVPYDSAFDVVIECRAGIAQLAVGARYEVRLDVVDLTDMRPVVRSVRVADGALGDPTWAAAPRRFVYSVDAPGPAYDWHVWKSFAHLRVGVRAATCSYAEAGTILITPP